MRVLLAIVLLSCGIFPARAARAPLAGSGQALPFFTGENVVVINRAVSGRSTKSYIDEGKWDSLMEELREGDLVLISFGHNDSRDDAPERYTRADGQYRANLVRFAGDVAARGGIPVILSPVARRLWEGPAMVETHSLYSLNARFPDGVEACAGAFRWE